MNIAAQPDRLMNRYRQLLGVGLNLNLLGDNTLNPKPGLVSDELALLSFVQVVTTAII